MDLPEPDGPMTVSTEPGASTVTMSWTGYASVYVHAGVNLRQAVTAPTLTSATYDASTGALAVTATGMTTGDTIVVSVTVHNRGVATESVPTRLILNGGPNKYPVIEYPPYPLQPGNSRTETFEVTLPAAPPGNYVLGLYGLGEGAPITLANPPLCDETTLETTATADAAMGTHYAFITGTNVGTRDCFIGAVRRVENYVDGIPNLLSNVGGLDQPSLPPLQSHVLRPGDRVGIVVSTTSSCLDGFLVEQPIEVLALHMSMRGVTPVTVDLRGVGVQSACDFSLSDWGAAPQ